MENGVKIRGFVLIGVFIASLVWTASASAQSDFYKGKTITVYIGTTPGALTTNGLVCWPNTCRNIFQASLT